MRILALTCEVLARAVYLFAARSPNVIDVRLNRRGLHDEVPTLRALLQGEIDEDGHGAGSQPGSHEPHGHEAVVLAYGLCGGAVAGLRAGSVPLVVPRAHDCVTLFLGSRERYDDETRAHPGTYWYVQDYLERSDPSGPFAGLGAMSDAAARRMHAEFVAKYGRDNADYLMEALGAWREHYDRAAFIDTNIAPNASAAETQAGDEAAARGWEFDRIVGELDMVRRLVDGEWDEDRFLVVQPGKAVAMSYDERVIEAVDVADPAAAGERSTETG